MYVCMCMYVCKVVLWWVWQWPPMVFCAGRRKESFSKAAVQTVNYTICIHTYIHTYILKTVHTFYDLIFATYISRGKFFAAYIHTYINAWTCNYSIHYIHSFRRRWCEQEARGELAGRVVQNVLRRLGYINVFVIRTYMHTYIHTSHTLFAH